MTNYKPVNNHVILERTIEQPVSSTGFIVGGDTEIYTVISTQDDSKELLNKIVYTNKPPIPLGENYYSVAIENIVAYKE